MSTNSESTRTSIPFASIAYCTLTPLGFILQGLLQSWCAGSIGLGTTGQLLATAALFVLHILIGAMVAAEPIVARTTAGTRQPTPSDAVKVALAVPILYGVAGIVLVVGCATGSHLPDHLAVLAISAFGGLIIHFVGCGVPAFLLELQYARENRRLSKHSR